jgi:hypothetical protein
MINQKRFAQNATRKALKSKSQHLLLGSKVVGGMKQTLKQAKKRI